jgi:hypothetical protein
MKSIIVIFMFLGMVLPFQASAQKRNIDVGVILSDPVRLSVKKWLGKTTAVDGAFYLKNDGRNNASGAFELHLDYLKHDFGLLQIDEGSLPIYYGVGIRIQNDQELKTALRIPIGVSFHFKKAPVSVFFEYAFLFDVTTPQSKLESESALGVRYSF